VENQNQYQETSLVEMIVVWLKAGKFAVCMGLLVTLLVAAVVASLTPMYDSKVSLQIGNLGEGLLVDPAVLVAQLKARHRVGDDTQGERIFPRLEKVSSDKRGDSPVVTLIARAYTAEGAAEFLKGITQKIVDSHTPKYQKNRQEKQVLYEKISLQKGDNGGVLAKIQSELAVMSPTLLLSSPTVPVEFAAPKKTILYTVSLVLGLMVTLVLPFLLAFINTIREELQRQAEK